MTETTLPEKPVSRRDFLKLAWSFFGGLAALETAGVFMMYLQPRLAEGEFGSIISAGRVDDFPPNSVTHISNGRFYIVRLGDGGFMAVYHRCTHLGCTVPWDSTAQKFICPATTRSSTSRAWSRILPPRVRSTCSRSPSKTAKSKWTRATCASGSRSSPRRLFIRNFCDVHSRSSVSEREWRELANIPNKPK